MDGDLQRAWVHQAQADADRGVIECRMCRRHGPLEEGLTLWRGGVLVFAVCLSCATRHEIVMRPAERGIEVRGRVVGPLIVGSAGVR